MKFVELLNGSLINADYIQGICVGETTCGVLYSFIVDKNRHEHEFLDFPSEFALESGKDLAFDKDCAISLHKHAAEYIYDNNGVLSNEDIEEQAWFNFMNEYEQIYSKHEEPKKEEVSNMTEQFNALTDAMKKLEQFCKK